ncbi:hypothetical protein KY285_027158 [Solanum tuberosum]|nr:hypothetical protein KY285_027158 [Solanum tuberosum]
MMKNAETVLRRKTEKKIALLPLDDEGRTENLLSSEYPLQNVISRVGDDEDCSLHHLNVSGCHQIGDALNSVAWM